MERLLGRTALITGGARGQGRAIAAKFASEGADIVILDICGPIDSLDYEMGSKAELDETRDLVEGAGRRCIAEVVDVRDEAAMTALATRTVEEFGGIDIAVANAGIHTYSPIWEMDSRAWQDVIDVNLTGVFNTIKAVAPFMMEAGHGNIILTASSNGVEGGINNASYTASKHGVVGLGRQAANELGPYNVRVNTVLPGPIHTPMVTNPKLQQQLSGNSDILSAEQIKAQTVNGPRHWHALRGRPILPASAIADAMIWLASDESQHVTGILLPVDAGHLVLPGMNPNPIVDDEIGTFDYQGHALSSSVTVRN